MMKVLSILGEVADHVKVKNEVSIQDRDALIVVAQDRRKKMIERGLREEMKLVQPSSAPTFPDNLVIQMLFFLWR